MVRGAREPSHLRGTHAAPKNPFWGREVEDTAAGCDLCLAMPDRASPYFHFQEGFRGSRVSTALSAPLRPQGPLYEGK